MKPLVIPFSDSATNTTSYVMKDPEGTRASIADSAQGLCRNPHDPRRLAEHAKVVCAIGSDEYARLQ